VRHSSGLTSKRRQKCRRPAGQLQANNQSDIQAHPKQCDLWERGNRPRLREYISKRRWLPYRRFRVQVLSSGPGQTANQRLYTKEPVHQKAQLGPGSFGASTGSRLVDAQFNDSARSAIFTLSVYTRHLAAKRNFPSRAKSVSVVALCWAGIQS